MWDEVTRAVDSQAARFRWPEAADALAAQLLGDLRTRLGGLHIAHARRVAERTVRTRDARIVAAALLHDVLEKTDVTAVSLRTMIEDANVVDLVEVLTHLRDEPYDDYLSRCAVNPKTLLIKRLDLADKLVTDDVYVAAAAAALIRRRAALRLARLNRIARAIHRDAVRLVDGETLPNWMWQPSVSTTQSLRH